MATWMAAYNSESQRRTAAAGSAMKSPAADISITPGHDVSKTADLVQQLRLDIPEFQFTVEVDLFGNHRVTVHFKGGQIAIDE